MPVCPRYDTVSIGGEGKLFDWIRAQLVEQLEIRRSFSSFDGKETGLNNIKVVEEAGYMSAELKRRANTIKARYNIR